MADAERDEHEHGRLQLDAFDITARARSSYESEGRLALPITARWPIFPFEADGLRMRLLEDPVVPEPPRRGETADDCATCQVADEHDVWNDGRWRVTMSIAPQSLPAVVLHTRAHLDFGDLTDEMGAGMGVHLVRIQRALAGIEGVGRVHVYRWGDGGAHLHILVVARPLGMMQLRGMFLTTWLHALPPLDAHQWTLIRSHVRTELAAPTAASPP